MKNHDLDSLLKRAKLPEIPEESSELFPRRVVAALKRGEREPRAARTFLPRLAWICGAAICIALAFAIGHWHGQMAAKSSRENDSLANLKLINETLAMFPNRVRAIVQDQGGLRLVLSDTDTVPTSPPLYVKICDGKNCTSLVTFSGQEIQIDGQKLTVLADPRGGIILTGTHFVWSNTERTYAGKNINIEAKTLGVVAM